METIKIDGSFGEGGGQIARSAVTLSAITGKPIEIENIRKNRKVPGLRPQHLVGIKILTKIFNARVEGLYVGSTRIKFFPSEVSNFELKENVGTAGSIPLILQILIPAVSVSKKSLRLSIIGGTDVPWSPTCDYTRFVVGQAFSRMGINFSLVIKKRGYYPKGGGLVEVEVLPCEEIKPVSLHKRTAHTARILCSFSKISHQSIERELDEAKRALEKAGYLSRCETNEEPAADLGCSFLIFAHDRDSITGSDLIYRNTTSGMGQSVASTFLESSLGVDAFLSDMLVVPLSLAGHISVFRVNKITKHLETNLFVASKITGCKYGIGKLENGFEIRIEGVSNALV